MMAIRFRYALSPIALLLSFVQLLSQQTTGAIRGIVTDPTGAVVSNVTVSAANDQTRNT